MNLACTTFPVRHLGAIAFCVVVVGTGAGTASADPPAQTHDYYAQVAVGTRPDDRAGIRGPNAPAFVTAATSTATAVRPDDRGGVRGINSVMVAARPHVSLGGGSSFDWGAAGIGAGGMLALVLIAGSLFVARGRLGAHDSGGSSPPPALRV
jgi:hypothetical protein